MKELEVLLNQRWVLKSENKELYYQLRDAIGDIRKYASDKLGCQVTENALMKSNSQMRKIKFIMHFKFCRKQIYWNHRQKNS